jgi:hypothetical protein
MFLDSVHQDVAEMIVERLESSDATMRATQLRVLGGAIAACRRMPLRMPTAAPGS